MRSLITIRIIERRFSASRIKMLLSFKFIRLSFPAFEFGFARRETAIRILGSRWTHGRGAIMNSICLNSSDKVSFNYFRHWPCPPSFSSQYGHLSQTAFDPADSEIPILGNRLPCRGYANCDNPRKEMTRRKPNDASSVVIVPVL